MSKISVGGTILQGYRFALRRVLSNLGLSWLAAVFYAVTAGYWLHQFCTTMLVSPHPGSELNDFALFDLFGFIVTTALGNAIIARTLTGAALEPGGEMMTAYFAVAKREWMLFLSLLQFYALVIVAAFAVALLGGLAISMAAPMIGDAQWQGIGALPAMNVAVAVAVFAVVATLIVRLGFLAAPIASAEHSPSAARAWSMSRGNGWRLFLVTIALSVPVLLLWAAAEWALLGNDLVDAATAATSTGHNSTALFQLIDSNAPAIAVVWTLLIVVLNMLFAGASAPAYFTVRDNVSLRQQPSVTSAPVLEPAFAGSFAGFEPHYAKAPVTQDVEPILHAEPVPETFVATPDVENPHVEQDLPIAAPEHLVEMHAAELEPVDARVAEASNVEMPVAEPEAVLTAVEEVPVAPVEMAHVEAALAPSPDDAHEPMLLANDIHHDDVVHHDDVHDAMPLPYTHEASFTEIPMSVAQFPLGAAETNASPAESVEAPHADTPAEIVELHAAASEPGVEGGDVTPRPSHDGEMELSPQNVPSEAA